MISLYEVVQVIKRKSGTWIDGRYRPAPEPAPVGIRASIQPAKSGDYDTMEAAPYGRRTGHMIRVYTEAYLTPAEAASGAHTGTPGDIVLGPRGRYVVIGVADFRMIPNSEVANSRYLAILEKETQGKANVG